ncbi:MAG: hypothetical protein K0S47_684 [Herbinix sp.]|nr:hypothetical protein [Herbinix sp.]
MAIVGAFIVPHPPIIIPEVGKGEEQKILHTIQSYQEIAKRIEILKPDTIVLTTPHSIMYSDYFHISPGKSAQGDLRKFGVKDVKYKVDYDEEFAFYLSNAAEKKDVAAGVQGEKDAALDHGTMIPLHFIKQSYTDFRLVRIGLSGLPLLDHYRLGRCIEDVSEQLSRRVVFVASGDLSHTLLEEGPYGYTPEGVEFDQDVTEAMKEGDFLRFLEFSPDVLEVAAECGLRSFVIMSGALSGKEVWSELLSYEGPFGVGYAVCSFEITGTDENRHFDQIYERKQKKFCEERKAKEDPYVRLARHSLETYVKTGTYAKIPGDLPEELLQQKAGIFVSLKMFGSLRGCIGTKGR